MIDDEQWLAQLPTPIAGVDEVGRGPLIGAVVTAAVILPDNHSIVGLTDSKKLSEKKREILAQQIEEQAVAYALGRAEAEEVDELNIFQATLLAMKRAVESLSVTPGVALIDGKHTPNIAMPAHAIVKGDGKVEAISAASILAKVTRDHEMIELHQQYPDYGFDRHKGYPTKAHLQAIEQHGILPQHRKSFGPVKRLLAVS